MAKLLIADELWTVFEPLLPPVRPRPKGEQPFIPHRAALTGTLFVLKSSIPWKMLTWETGCGSAYASSFSSRDRQFAHADAGRVVDRVGDRRGDADHRRFRPCP